MSGLLRLFDKEYAIDGHYLQYVDSYPSLQMIKDIPRFLYVASGKNSQPLITNFIIGGLYDNNNAIKNISSITKNLDYKTSLYDKALSVLLKDTGRVDDFVLNKSDYDLLKSMNGTLEGYLKEGMKNSNDLYKKIIMDYLNEAEFPAHFHNISFFLKNDKSLNDKTYDPVWKILSNELKCYCLAKI